MKRFSLPLIIPVLTLFLMVACAGNSGEPPEIYNIFLDILEPEAGQQVEFSVVASDPDNDSDELVYDAEVIMGDGLLNDTAASNAFHYDSNLPGEHIFNVTVEDPQGNTGERAFSIMFK